MPTVRRPVNVLYEVNRTAQTVAKGFSYTVPTTCLFAKVKAYGRMGDTVTYLGQPYPIGEEFEVAPGAVVTAEDSAVQLTLDQYTDGGTVDSEGRIRSPAGQQQQIQSLVSAPGIPGTAHPRYFTHLFAGNQLADDPKVYDISGALGHATPEADLSLSALWTTTPGYASTLDPTTTVGQKLRRLMLPVLMWDWAGGESLFIWGLVKAAFEAAACSFMGNNIGGSAENGFRIRVSTAGKLVLAMQQGTTYSYSSTASTLSAFDGALHSFGIWMDAAARNP